MGDVILTTSLVRQIKKTYPNSKIDFLVAKPFSEIYKFNPYISNIIEYDKTKSKTEISKFRDGLIRNNSFIYNYIIDLQKNRRSIFFLKGLGEKIFTVKKNRLHKLSLVYFKRPKVKNLSIPHVYLETAAELGIIDDKLGLEIWLPEEANSSGYPPHSRQLNKEISKIAIAPGAHHFTKRWPADKFIALIKELKSRYKAEIVLIGGKTDRDLCSEISSALPFEVDDQSGSTSILKTAEIINSCDLLVCNDTGVMHMAAARRVPLIAIFGSTVKELGFMPFRSPNIIVEKNVKCRPCSHIGRHKCPKKHFNCMNLIETDDIISAIINLFGNNTGIKNHVKIIVKTK